MSQDPEAIRHDIEQTQVKLGDTVEALAYRTDIPARAKDAVSDRVDALKTSASNAAAAAKSAVTGLVSDAADTLPSPAETNAKARSLMSFAKSNPLSFALGALAVGSIVGLVLPVTKIERDTAGPIGDQLNEKLHETISDSTAGAVAKGKEKLSRAAAALISGEG